MKNINLMKKALPIAMLPLAAAVNAQVQTVSVGFTTLPEITITESQAMAFGSVLSLTPADSCIMTVSPTQTVLPSQDRSSLAQAGSAGALTGQCTNDVGTPGIYFITGIQGADVQVTLTGSTNADISFSPAGYVVDTQTAVTASDDQRVTVADDGTNNDVVVTTHGTSEFSATVQPGVVGLVLGGTVVNQRALLADTAVTADFTVDVIYN